MEILALRARIPEQSVNAVITEHLGDDIDVQNLSVRLSPAGVHVRGDYPTGFMKVPFEMVWAVEAVGGLIQARLENLSVSGLPAGILRGVLFKMIRENARQHAGVQVDGDTVRIDAEAAARAKGVELKLNLTRLVWGAGEVTVEAGEPG